MGPDRQPSGSQLPERARVFFALWPDEGARAALGQAAVDGARRFGGRTMQEETLHLTLAFIGDVPLEELAVLRAAASAVDGSAFDLSLDCLGFWGHNRILWAGSQGHAPGLSRLADSLAGRLKEAGHDAGLRTGRAFAPHVTLVRNVAEKRPSLPALAPIPWLCREFVLVRSRLSARGAAYEIIGRWPLRSWP